MTTARTSPDDLATAFIQLNTCQTHLVQARKQGFSDLTPESKNLHDNGRMNTDLF